MFYLVYVSSAVEPFSEEQLTDLLTKARKFNTSAGISGMLLYKDGNFMQVLEGEEAVIRALHAKIDADPRHEGVLTVMQGFQEARQFKDWSMGFTNLDDPQSSTVEGYSEFMNVPLNDESFFKDPSRCQRLLMRFKKQC